MTNSKINILLSIISCFILDRVSYSPYGEFSHYVSIASSFFVFLTLYGILINKRVDNIFIISFIGMNWIYFQYPFLLQEKTSYYPRIILEEYIDTIAIYTGLSIFLIYIGYFFFFNNVKPISSKSIKISTPKLKQLIYLFIALSVFYRVGKVFIPSVIYPLSNLVQILFYSPAITFSLYTLYLIRHKSFPKFSLFHILTILFLLTELLYQISTTLFVGVALFFSGALLVYFLEKKKLPIKQLIIIGIILLPIYQTRKYFRFSKHSDKISNVKGLEKGTNIVQSILSDEGEANFDKYENREKSFLDTRNRFENLSFISQVVYHHTKKKRPFLYGETFYWLPLVPIPRILFPSKPINEMQTKVSTSYNLRHKKSNGAINFPMLCEAYINFGFLGMLFLALCFGISYKWFAMKFGIGMGDLNLIIAINCIKQLIHAEGNITLVFGALIQVFLFWFILIKVFGIDKRLSKEYKEIPNS